MDTRMVSPAIRRRVGESACSYLAENQGHVIQSTPITTDWGVIEAAFAAKTTAVGAPDYTGGVR
jgi:hypothetical protein